MTKQNRPGAGRRPSGNQDKLSHDAMLSTAFGLWALDAFEAEKEEFEACCRRTDQLERRNAGLPDDPDDWLLRDIEARQRARARAAGRAGADKPED